MSYKDRKSGENWEDLYPYCQTDRQRQAIEALIKVDGNRAEASRLLGVTERRIYEMIGRIKGLAPGVTISEHRVPEGQMLKGTSVLYGPEGDVRLTWVKSDRDNEESLSQLRIAAEELFESVPRVKPIVRIPKVDQDLVNCFVITDYHLGMKAWSEETRDEDWDTSIAENLLTQWFLTAISQAPKAHTGLFAQLGDFLHWDGLDAVTPVGKHNLDADTRFQLLVRVGIRLIKNIVRFLLDTHEHVVLIMAEGNHDIASSVWLRELLRSHYENEPRVTVDTSVDPYYCFEWGKTSIFFHHGHKRKVNSMDTVFVSKFRDVFGRTKHSYAHSGHYHHIVKNETNLMVVEQHRTLASSDAYAARGGYSSGRDAQCITYHKEYGEVGRVIVSPEMARSAYGKG